jgi:phosphoadenylyl-sulfate reductase (thioredoxin)
MAQNAIQQALIEEFKGRKDPADLIGEIFRRFGDRAAIGTSGQLTGVAMIDLAVRAGIKPRVFTIDTHRLFPETYQLFEQIEKKYGIQVERVMPDPVRLEGMIKEHGEYLFFDSREKQKLCCRIRKVEPNEKILATLDAWFSGLRVDQSASRAETEKFEILRKGPEQRPILKISPLLEWTEEELRQYAKQHQVPIHPLLSWQKDGWYFESLGCVICTTPVGPNEPRRAGRWRWFQDEEHAKECGLHVEHEDEV